MNSSAEAILADADERLRRQERNVGEFVREEPLTGLAIAGAAGFFLCGGLGSRLRLALLSFVGGAARGSHWFYRRPGHRRWRQPKPGAGKSSRRTPLQWKTWRRKNRFPRSRLNATTRARTCATL